MMKRAMVGTVLALLFGCATTPQEAKGPWITLVEPWGRGSQYRGYIALPARTEPKDVITIYVRGAVRSPGAYKVPSGTTLLQAVIIAGGFSIEAVALSIEIQDGKSVIRPNPQRREEGGRRPLVWYGDPDRAEDFVLKDGMQVSVPMF